MDDEGGEMVKETGTDKRGLTVIDGGRPDEGSPGNVEHRGGDTTGGKLTARQHGFINSILKEHMNQSDAYRANYTTGGMTDKTVWEKASRLFAQDKVRTRIEAGRRAQEQIAVHSGASLRADLISKLKVLTDSSESDAVKIRAIEVLGKTELVSLFLERTSTVEEEMSAEEIEKELVAKLKATFGESA
jgi:hypothetical protein